MVPEKTTLRLRTHYGAKRVKLIHTRHGAGDRAVGFDAASAGFDLALLSGPKILRRLRAANALPPRFAIVGYAFYKLGCEPAPLLLGFILGPMMEENLRRALLLSRGDWSTFVTRPISAVILALTVDTTGRATACRIYRSSGLPETDEVACRLAKDRLRFRPATNALGEPIVSTFYWQQKFFF